MSKDFWGQPQTTGLGGEAWPLHSELEHRAVSDARAGSGLQRLARVREGAILAGGGGAGLRLRPNLVTWHRPTGGLWQARRFC